MYNKLVLQGNLTRDIELKYLQSGSAIANSSIAVNKKYKTQSGEQKEKILFLELTFFGKTAEIANQYVRKGSKVLLDGELVFDQWVAQDGTKRSKHSLAVSSLVMLDSKPNDNIDRADSHNVSGSMNKPSADQTYTQNVKGAGGQDIPVEIDINEDEIPF